MITLHSQYNCCYPRPEGKNYQVDLYQIQNNKGKLKLKSYTYVLGDYADGFEGQTDVREKSIFKFKDIASIKKWLDKNYK
ncbi:hypothetical protein KPC_3055 [Acinetobacter stercoris]|uniref:Uncharacterized protein n=1 Tax=Acinetobacter stercoris TaxID=2126983 RepID=A0A2U3N2F6_9GAMM|nr:hypothetical protein KPC_3055 [Acinetobacter stercoris]